ncbi:MAG: hypothetical protein Q9187_004903 [Circinaria calcarea]
MIYRLLVTPQSSEPPHYHTPLEVKPYNKKQPRGVQYPTAPMYVNWQMHNEYAAVLYNLSTVKIEPGKMTGRHVPDGDILRTDLVRGGMRALRSRGYVAETKFKGCIYSHILMRFEKIHLVLRVTTPNPRLGIANLAVPNLILCEASQMLAIFTALSSSASTLLNGPASQRRKGFVLRVYTIFRGGHLPANRDAVAEFLAREFNRLGCERLLMNVLEGSRNVQIEGLSDMQIGALLDGLN